LKDLLLNINQDKSITIKNEAKTLDDSEWKSKTMREIKSFFAKRATYAELKMAKAADCGQSGRLWPIQNWSSDSL